MITGLGNERDFLKKGIFLKKILLGVFILFVYLLCTQLAVYAADGDSFDIFLLDTNSNGKIETILFSVDNTSVGTWGVDGNPNIVVEQDGRDITITNVTLVSAADANPVVFAVILDENDADLVFNTDGVVTEPIELIYTQSDAGVAACTNCITDGANAQLNTIADGDTNATDTEIDMAAPVVLEAYYRDTNGNGHVDRAFFVLAPDNGIVCNPLFAGSVDFTVTVAGTINFQDDAGDTCGTNGTNNFFIDLNVGGDAGKTGGVVDPDVSYETGVVEDAAGNQILNNGVTLSDDAAPVILGALYRDHDGDGQVDRVRFVTSIDVGIVCGTFVALTDFIVDVAGTVNISEHAGDICATNGTSHFEIVLGSPGDADITGGAVNPEVEYVQSGIGVEDGAGNATPSSGIIPALDGAAPIILGAIYRDHSGNGQVDRVRFVTSIDVGIVCGTFVALTDFLVDSSGTVNISEHAGDTCATNGTSHFEIVLGSPGNAGITGGAFDPEVEYIQSGIGVEDGEGNATPSSGIIPALDGAAPISLSALYVDTNSDGEVDAIDITMTQDMGLTCAFEGGDWVIAEAGTINANTPSACSINGNVIRVSISANAFFTGGVVDPEISYTDQGTLGSVKDGSNNAVVSFANLEANDGASPVIIGSVYRDHNVDGQVDRVRYSTSFDTGLDCGTFVALTDFLVDFNGTINISEHAGDTCVTNGTSHFEIVLGSLGNAGVTGGPFDPETEYVQSGIGFVDGAGNLVPSSGVIPALDGAAPVLLSTSPSNNATGVSRIAVPTLTFSERMDTTTFAFDANTAPTGGYTLNWTSGDTIVEFTHNQAFLFSTVYDIEVTVAKEWAVFGEDFSSLVANPFSFLTQGSGGGGGGGAFCPHLTSSFSINNGSTTTNSQQITLHIDAGGANQMIFSEDANFLDANYINISSTHTFTLSPQEGNKTIYALFKSNCATSNVISKQIQYVKTDEAQEEMMEDVYPYSTIEADKSVVLANGQEGVIVSVRIVGENNQPIVGIPVQIMSSRSMEDMIVPSSSTTDQFGKAFFTVTSNYAGISTFNAKANGIQVERTVSVQFKQHEQEMTIPIVALQTGDLVKEAQSAAVYYYGKDGKRHAFINAPVFHSYYDDFSSVKIISSQQLAGIALGSNVKVRPGTWLVKIQTDPKVYAVSPNGVLHWIQTEDIARTLYGDNWNAKIIDIPDSMFLGYTIGETIMIPKLPNGAIFSYQGSIDQYYVDNGKKRKITGAFGANRLNLSFLQSIPSHIMYEDGASVTKRESLIADAQY